jgi:hypothetical protein
VRVHIGVDLGKVVDCAAIVLCEVTPTLRPAVLGRHRDALPPAHVDPLSPLGLLRIAPAAPALADPTDHLARPRTASLEATYTARLIERIPLDTSYPDVAKRVKVIVVRLLARLPRVVPEIYVDAGGVGIPVIDILRGELAGIPHRLVPVTITGGEGYHDVVTADGADRKGRVVPRSARGLSVGKGFLVSRLQALLQTQRFVGARELVKELQDELRIFQTKAQGTHDVHGAAGSGHDDLVIAGGLACLNRPRQDARAVEELNATLGGPTIVGDGPASAWQV